jgi:hypothetical protein
LDHEQLDMSETREPANADRYPAIPRLAGDIAPFDYAQGRLWQGGRFHFFFTKMLHFVQHFCEKETKVPCCRRRIEIPRGQTSGLHVHRVRPVKTVNRFSRLVTLSSLFWLC